MTDNTTINNDPLRKRVAALLTRKMLWFVVIVVAILLLLFGWVVIVGNCIKINDRDFGSCVEATQVVASFQILDQLQSLDREKDQVVVKAIRDMVEKNQGAFSLTWDVQVKFMADMETGTVAVCESSELNRNGRSLTLEFENSEVLQCFETIDSFSANCANQTTPIQISPDNIDMEVWEEGMPWGYGRFDKLYPVQATVSRFACPEHNEQSNE